MAKFFYTDGRATKGIDPWHSDGEMWTYNSNPPSPTEVKELYSKVSAVYRAINFTADTLAGMPFAIMQNGKDIDTSDEYQNTLGFLPYPRQLFELITQSLLVTNKAYAFQETKGSQLLKLRYIAPATVAPDVDKITGDLLGFSRTINGRKTEYKIDAKGFCNIVYLFNLNWENELLPDDSSPFKAMMNAAGIGLYADTYIKDFFARGGIKPTILTFDGVLDKTSMEDVEKVWTKVIRGVYRFLGKVFNGKFTPIVIGEGIEALKDEKVYDNALRNIAIAVGMPQDALLQNADSYATAQVHKSTWYSDTLTPLAQSIAEPLNEQVFKRLGYRFEFRPDAAEPNMEEESNRINGANTLYTILSKANRKDADKVAIETMGIDLPAWFKWEVDEMAQQEKELGLEAQRMAIENPQQKPPIKGGPGSGNFDHEGRPGEVGGSAPSGLSSSKLPTMNKEYNTMEKLADGVMRGERNAELAADYLISSVNTQIRAAINSGRVSKATITKLNKIAKRGDLTNALSGGPQFRISKLEQVSEMYELVLEDMSRGKSIEMDSVFVENTISIPALREMTNWQELAFRKLKRGQSLKFDWTPKDIPQEQADAIKAKLDNAQTEEEIKAAFEIPNVSETVTPAPVYDTDEIKALVDALNKAAEVVEVKAEPVMPTVNITMSPITVNNQQAAQEPPTVTVTLPEQPAPVVNVTNEVQPTPIEVTNDVRPSTVKVEKPSSARVIRDRDGKITGLETK